MKRGITLILATILSLYFWPKAKTSNIPFSRETIVSAFGQSEEKEELPEEIHIALSQPYRYLGSGGQCYVFQSHDDQYVIKFLKQKNFKPSSWMHWYKRDKKLKRLNQVQEAFTLSHEQLAEETAILYVHWRKTSRLHQTLAFNDHTLSLDDVWFVLQRKAELAATRIHSLVQQNDSESAQDAIDKIVALQKTIAGKGFRNKDPNFRSNYGFVGDKAVLIDVGRIVKENSPPNDRNLKRFRQYLSDNHPQLLEHFDSLH